MLSLFPSLLFLEQLAPLLLRLALAAVFIYWSYRVLRTITATSAAKTLGLVEGLAGILLVIGLWTQAAALVIIVDLIIRLVGKMRQRLFLIDGVNYYLILLVIAISLLFTGAGAFAFDMPM